MTNGGSEDILARLKEFESSAQQRIEKLEAMQGEIDELLNIPDAVAVSIRLDAEGRVLEFSIDKEQAQSLSVDTLEHDINLAFVEANRSRPQRDPEHQRAQATSQGIDLTEALESVFARESQGLGAVPSPVRNDSRTVSVTLQGSAVLRVTCDHAWLQRSSTDTVAAEIMKTVNDAIRSLDEDGTTHG